MARKLREVSAADVDQIRAACRMLQDARDSLSGVGAKRAAAYVARALKSARGAERHAYRAMGPSGAWRTV